jgi:hypothetical protein
MRAKRLTTSVRSASSRRTSTRPLAELALMRNRHALARELVDHGLAAVGDQADRLMHRCATQWARVEATTIEHHRPRRRSEAERFCRELDRLLESAGRRHPPPTARARQTSCRGETFPTAGQRADAPWLAAADASAPARRTILSRGIRGIRVVAPSAVDACRRRRPPGGRSGARTRPRGRRAATRGQVIRRHRGLARAHRLGLEMPNARRPSRPRTRAARVGLTPREAQVLS